MILDMAAIAISQTTFSYLPRFEGGPEILPEVIISNETFEVQSLTWPICQDSSTIVIDKSCNSSWFKLYDEIWLANSTNSSCSDDFSISDDLSLVSDFPLCSFTGIDGRSYCLARNNNSIIENTFKCQLYGMENITGICETDDGNSSTFWLGFVIFYIVSVRIFWSFSNRAQ